MAQAKTDTSSVPAAQPRIFTEQKTLIHDLFRLKIAQMVRNISWTAQPEYINVAHEHFFHTYDSDGHRQTRSTAVGNHFHDIKVIPGASPDAAPTIEVGPAKREAKRFLLGKWTKVSELIPEDSHTHTSEYIKSHPLVLRTLSKEAATAISKLDVAPQSVPGIQG